MLVTGLNPTIGYDKSAEIAKKAYEEEISLKEAAINLGYISKDEFNKLIDPLKMTRND